MNKTLVDYYALLGVPRDANIASIRERYHQLHAELKNDERNYQKALLLREAMTTLADPVSRAAFDQLLIQRPPKQIAADLGHDSSKRMLRNSPSALGYSTATDSRSPGSTEVGWECEFCGHAAQSRSITWAELDCPICASPLEIPRRVDDVARQKASERLVARYARRAPLLIESNWPQLASTSGHLLDLSTYGLRFACAQDFPLAMILRLDCELLISVCRVAHCQPPDPAIVDRSSYVIGVEFRTLRFKRPTANFLDAKA